MDETANDPDESSAMNDERKFLETLLKDRFNFFIVSAPVYLFGVFHAEISHVQRLWALGIGLIIFSLFAYAIWRTSDLINHALDMLGEGHPYSRICEDAGPSPRANNALVIVPLLFIALGAALFITTFTEPLAEQTKAKDQAAQLAK